MKKLLCILFIAFFAVSGLKIGNFHFDEDLALINVVNTGKNDIDDVRVRLFFLDDADIFVSSRFDLDNGEVVSAKFFLPDYLSGWVKIVVSNDDIKNTKYVYI